MTVRPFSAWRPTNGLAEKVSALPYDVYGSAEAREAVKGNPYSFLHVDKAEIDLESDIDVYDQRVYEKARDNLLKMKSDGIFVQDAKPCLYIYSLTMHNRTQTGLVACTSVDEYLSGKIKKHELTREDKEIDRIKHVDICNANTGPIFLTYRFQETIDNLINEHMKQKPVADFVSEDFGVSVRNRVWVIDDEETINKLTSSFDEVQNFYIADGHHRNASAVKVALARREKNQDTNAEHNFYLSVIFPDNQLQILDYNRVVKDLNGLTNEAFIQKLSKSFEIEKQDTQFRPQHPHTFGMYMDKTWYALRCKPELIERIKKSGKSETDMLVDLLDVSILQNHVLAPVLGINDIRTDKRIDFVGGLRGLDELCLRVNSGEAVAFAMYPTSLSELMEIADSGGIMPPKSTWFEPKLRSGLFIHDLTV